MQPLNVDVGPFRLLYPVGRGATASVWRATHRATDTSVAIKVFTRIGADAKAQRRAFAREVRAVAELDHGAIIRVHDYGTFDPSVGPATDWQIAGPLPYLVMDWQGGGTLRDRRGQMRFAEIKATLLTLLDALAHAHARGVVHRDLKPANVLVGRDGPVLSDFGLVFNDEVSSDGVSQTSGTPNYMAPEQVTGDWRAFGPWTDLYALGCVAWALATGRPPYAGQGVHAALMGHVSGVVPLLDASTAIPDGFAEWVYRLLEKAPGRRYRFAADAAVALMAMEAEPGPEPDDDRTIAQIVADESEPTVRAPPVFIALDETGWSDGPTSGTRPPMPAHWMRPDPPWSAHLPGCGRGLAELREMRLRGRIEARDALWHRLRAVQAGDGCQVAVISGEAGIGKTHLMRWLARRGHELGQAETVAITHAPAPDPAHGITPIFHRHFRLDGLPADEAGWRLGALLGLEAPLAAALAALQSPDLTARVDDFRITLSRREIPVTVIDGLAAWAKGRPLVVQIDDAQWGEEAVQLVQRVVDHRLGLPILFVLTVRTDVEVDRRVRRTLDRLVRRPETVHIELGPLAAGHHDDTSAARLPLEPETRDRLGALTAGNPLFAAELLRHWLHIDALAETPTGFRLARHDPALLPASLPALIRVRLDSLLGDLSPDPIPALELAAVLGSVVDDEVHDAALALAALPHPNLAVDRLLDAGIVTAAPGGFAFTHARVREVLQSRAVEGDRWARWNAVCAAALITIAERRGHPVDPVRQALHLTAARRWTPALTHWRGAIEAAENAWGALTEIDAPLVIEAARCARRAGLRTDAPEWLELKISWSAHLNTRRRGLGLRHAQKALDRARRGGSDRVAARALRQVARCLRDRGDLDGAVAHCRASERISSAIGDAMSLSATRRLRATVAFLRGDLTTAEDVLRQVLDRLGAADVDDGPVRRYQQMEAWNQLGEIARQRGDLDAAARAYTSALDILGDDDTYLPALIQLNLALIDLARDEGERAGFRARRAHPRLIRAGNPRYAIYAEAVLLACAAESGDAGAWDRAWRDLGPVVGMDFVYLDVARLLDRAGSRARETLPERSARARAIAALQYRALGRHDDAARVETSAEP